jgi:predicted permease
MSWVNRLIGSFRKNKLEDQLNDELQFHIEMRTREFIAAGTTPEEARRQALRLFGNPLLQKERSRDMDTIGWIDTLWQDLRYGIRMLRKNPGFTSVAVLSLAVGIGANTAIFTVINGVVLRPLPYHEPERLVFLDEQQQPSGNRWSMAYLNYLDCAHESHSFQSMAAYLQHGANLTAPGEPEYVGTREISAGFFSVLGIQPALGRTFLPQEDRLGAVPVAILSHAFWQKRFAGDPRALGTRMIVNGKSYAIVGVLPADFHFFENAQIFTPIGQDDGMNMRSREFHSGIWAIARLKPDISVDQARSELNAIGHRLAQQYPDTNGDRTFGIMPLTRYIVGDVGPTLFLLAGAVGLVLLIACANVGNLLLARSISRNREFAIRAALGAGRGRVARQILTESTLLGLAGGLAGLLIAYFGTRSVLLRLPGDLPRMEEISLDARVLLFTFLVSVFNGIVFGLAPALRQRSSLELSLKQGARGNTIGFRRLQGSFVVAEVALAFVLLAGSGLMLRTMLRLWAVSPGFDPHDVLVTGVGLSPYVVKDPALIRIAWREVLSKVQNIPGVESAAVNSIVPFRGDENEIQYWTGAVPPPLNQIPVALAYTPTPNYFHTMRIPLLRGRLFTEQDRLGTEPVVIIDELLAERAFHGRDPVSENLNLQFLGPARIVGVAEHVKHFSLDEDPRADGREQIYLPFAQIPDPFMRLMGNVMSLLVRTSVKPSSIVQAVRQSVLGPGRDQPVYSMETMEQMIGDSMGRRRLMLLLLGIFAAVALILASVGIYGVISYATTRRVQEIGIRMALGATPKDVLKLISAEGLVLTAIALVLGLGGALALAHFLTSMLYGIRPTDPVTYVGVAALLGGVALIACIVPARRASRVDPMVALRYE